MNAADAIEERALKEGWHRYAREYSDNVTEGRGWMLTSYAKDNVILKVRYVLFGTPSNYMLRFYGKDPRDGVNWGVDYAEVKVIVESETGVKSWWTRKAFVGPKKKNQILNWLKGKE